VAWKHRETLRGFTNDGRSLLVLENTVGAQFIAPVPNLSGRDKSRPYNQTLRRKSNVNGNSALGSKLGAAILPGECPMRTNRAKRRPSASNALMGQSS
jgi:hypothetical protein